MQSAGHAAPRCIEGPLLCALLGVSPYELQQLDADTIRQHLAYQDGKSLAEWVSEHPAPRQKGGR